MVRADRVPDDFPALVFTLFIFSRSAGGDSDRFIDEHTRPWLPLMEAMVDGEYKSSLTFTLQIYWGNSNHKSLKV